MHKRVRNMGDKQRRAVMAKLRAGEGGHESPLQRTNEPEILEVTPEQARVIKKEADHSAAPTQLDRGTEIFYHGDRANDQGFGVITNKHTDKWGTFVNINMSDGREFKRISLSHISDEYLGHGGTSFVTRKAYEEYREENIKKMLVKEHNTYPELGTIQQFSMINAKTKTATGSNVRVELIKTREVPKTQIKGPSDVYEYTRDMQDLDREYVKVLYLDTKNRVSGVETISVGSLNSAIVHPREVFKGATLANAAGIIVVHNHPSGEAVFSPEDIATAELLKESGQTMGIQMLDFMAVGTEGYKSIKGDI